MQYKHSPLYILSWIPFGILFYPPFMDKGPKAYDYDKEITVGRRMLEIPQRSDGAKEIMITKVGIDLEANKIKYRYFPTYRNYLHKSSKKKTETNKEKEKLEIENTIFSGLLNELLKEKGYIDTTNKVLKNSYLNNLQVEASIKGYTLHNIAHSGYSNFGGMVYIDLSIDWKVLDYYNKPVFDYSTQSRSGTFGFDKYFIEEQTDIAIRDAIKDAIEGGLIEFLSSEEVIDLMNSNDELTLEESFDEIVIPKAKNYVTGLSQAINASVTVKNKKGHGSGFIISDQGYLITNYHVVADTDDLKVITNDKKEYPVEIVRISKIHDLALLKIESENLVPFMVSNSKDIEIASEIYAIGTPTAEDLSQTISRGIISGIRNTEMDSQLIQTDASVNSGNSGGAIVDKNGLVLGVVSSKLKGFGIEGVAFGIPAYEIFDKLKLRLE